MLLFSVRSLKLILFYIKSSTAFTKALQDVNGPNSDSETKSEVHLLCVVVLGGLVRLTFIILATVIFGLGS